MTGPKKRKNGTRVLGHPNAVSFLGLTALEINRRESCRLNVILVETSLAVKAFSAETYLHLFSRGVSNYLAAKLEPRGLTVNLSGRAILIRREPRIPMQL